MVYNNIADEKIFQYEGRILKKKGVSCLGYTNSYVRFYAKGKNVRMHLTSNITSEVNMAGLSVLIDGVEVNRVVVDKEQDWYEMCILPEGEHLVTVIKITEAAMSHVGILSVEISDGNMIDKPFPERSSLKLEFVGDSITCGYGVLGEPESEYTLREEDGMLSYGQVAAEILGARARFLSASGYGMYIEYTGDREGNVPKLYPYTNWFVDKEEKYDYSEYVPDVVVINLGTNDSGHIDDDEIKENLLKSYVEFIEQVKNFYPETKVLCICGTLCDKKEVIELIKKAVEMCSEKGINDVYMKELPFHNVEEDGKASNHPSAITHKKDGERVAGYIKEILEQE